MLPTPKSGESIVDFPLPERQIQSYDTKIASRSSHFLWLYGRTVCIPKICHREILRLACVVGRGYSSISSCYSSSLQTISPRHLILRALFPTPPSGLPTPLREGGPITRTTPFNLSWGRLPSTEIFRLIAGVDGLCVGRIGGVRQQLVENSGIQALDFSQSRLNLRQCSNERNTSMSLA